MTTKWCVRSVYWQMVIMHGGNILVTLHCNRFWEVFIWMDVCCGLLMYAAYISPRICVFSVDHLIMYGKYFVCVCVCACTCACMFVYMISCLCVCVCAHAHVCVFICFHVCVCVCDRGLKGQKHITTITSDGCKGQSTEVRFLEHVQCRITLSFHPRGSIVLHLTSPQVLFCTSFYTSFPPPSSSYIPHLVHPHTCTCCAGEILSGNTLWPHCLTSLDCWHSLLDASCTIQYSTIQLYCPCGEIPLAVIWTQWNIKHYINMVYLRFKRQLQQDQKHPLNKSASRLKYAKKNFFFFLSLSYSMHMPTHICNTHTHSHTSPSPPPKNTIAD